MHFELENQCLHQSAHAPRICACVISIYTEYIYFIEIRFQSGSINGNVP